MQLDEAVTRTEAVSILSLNAVLLGVAGFGLLQNTAAAAQCNCSCPCSSSQPTCPSQPQQNVTQPNQTQQSQLTQAQPQSAAPVRGGVIYNPWYAENSVPYFSAYPFAITPYVVFERPVPAPIPAPPTVAAR